VVCPNNVEVRSEKTHANSVAHERFVILGLSEWSGQYCPKEADEAMRESQSADHADVTQMLLVAAFLLLPDRRSAMKNTILAAVLMIGVAACTQKTESTTSADATATTSTSTTTVSTTVPAVDTAATAEAKRDVKDAGKDVAAGARDAAHATGTAMETAGKEIQKRTKPDRH